MKLTIDLQEGFENDEVIIFEKQKEIFHDKNITTLTQLGVAKSIEIEVSEKKPRLKIVIPSRGISENKGFDITKGKYLTVSITNENKLEWKSAAEPQRYM